MGAGEKEREKKLLGGGKGGPYATGAASAHLYAYINHNIPIIVCDTGQKPPPAPPPKKNLVVCALTRCDSLTPIYFQTGLLWCVPLYPAGSVLSGLHVEAERGWGGEACDVPLPLVEKITPCPSNGGMSYSFLPVFFSLSRSPLSFRCPTLFFPTTKHYVSPLLILMLRLPPLLLYFANMSSLPMLRHTTPAMRCQGRAKSDNGTDIKCPPGAL